MRHDTKKPVFGFSDQGSLRVLQTGLRSPRRLETSDIETTGIVTARMRWSVPSLFAYDINRFSHDVAHIMPVINWLLNKNRYVIYFEYLIFYSKRSSHWQLQKR